MKGLETMKELERYIMQTNKQSKYNNGGNAIDNYIKYINDRGDKNLVPLLDKATITAIIEKEIIKQIKTLFDKKV